MKKILVLSFLLWAVFVLRVEAQREPQFTHYMLNKLVYNPAYAGSKDDICATILYHNQWTDFRSDLDKSKAPITQTFTLHGPLDGLGAKNFGAGLTLINDALGFENSFSILLSGAYKKEIKKLGTLSGGLNVGLQQVGLKGDWKAGDPNDPKLKGVFNDKVLDLGLGLYLMHPKYYAGISSLHINDPKLTWSGTGESKIPRVIYLMGGYNYPVKGSKLELRTGTLIKTDMAKLQFDIHAIAEYDRKFWGGLNYHTGDAISLLLGLSIIPNGGVSYSYDLTVSDARPFGGKHEVLAYYCFNFDINPRYRFPPRDTRFLGGGR